MRRPLFTKKEIGETVDELVESALAAAIIGAAAVINPKKTVPPLAKLAAHSLEQGVERAVLCGRFIAIHAEAAAMIVKPVVSETASRVYYTTATAAAIAVVLPIAFALDMYDEEFAAA